MSVEVSKVRGISWEDLESLRQEKTQLAIRHPYSNFLILSEPKPTFTGGKRADDSELLPSAPNSGAAIHRASRGGRWTFHGPGQMLIYPIFRLTEFGFPSRGVRPFLDRFSAGIVEWLEGLGLKAALGEPFGIYVDGKKLRPSACRWNGGDQPRGGPLSRTATIRVQTHPPLWGSRPKNDVTFGVWRASELGRGVRPNR